MSDRKPAHRPVLYVLTVCLISGAIFSISHLCGQTQPDDKEPPSNKPSPGARAYRRGDYEKAVDLLTTEFEKDPAAVSKGVMLAKSLAQLGKYDTSAGVCRQVLKQAPDHPQAVLLLGQNLAAGRKWVQALPFLERAIKGKKKPRNRTLVGKCKYFTGKPAESYAEFSKAAEDFPANPVNYYFLGLIDVRRGYGSRGVKNLLLAEQFGTTEADLDLLMARAFALQEKYLGTLKDISMVEANTRLKGARPELAGGIDLMITDGVIVAVDSPVKGRVLIAPVDSAIYRAQKYLGETGKAKKPGYSQALMIIARSYVLLGNFEKAMALFKGIDSGSVDSTRRIVLEIDLNIGLGNLDKAREMVLMMTAGGTFDKDQGAQGLYKVALVQMGKGQNEAVSETLKGLLKIDPQNARALRLSGHLAMARRNWAGAREAYRKLIDFHPDAHDAENIHNIINRLNKELPR